VVAPDNNLWKGAHEIWKQVVFWSFQHSIKNDLKKEIMKQFKIDVSHASPGQILTIAAELKIMSNNWERFGPRIWINGQKLQAPELHETRSKRQASSSKRHNMARFI